jgi:hypothetical protein
MWLKKAVTREERIVVTHFGGQYMTVHLTQNLLFTDNAYFLSAETSLLQTTGIRAVLIRDRLWNAPLRSEGRCVGCHYCHTINRTHYVKRMLLRRSRKRALWASTVMTSFLKIHLLSEMNIRVYNTWFNIREARPFCLGRCWRRFGRTRRRQVSQVTSPFGKSSV